MDNGKLAGVINMTDITTAMANFKLTKDQPIENIINTFYKTFSINDKIKHLSKAFSRHKYVLAINEANYYVCQSKDVIRLFMKKNNKK